MTELFRCCGRSGRQSALRAVRCDVDSQPIIGRDLKHHVKRLDIHEIP